MLFKNKLANIFKLKEKDSQFDNLIQLWQYLLKQSKKKNMNLPTPEIVKNDNDDYIMIWENNDQYFKIFYINGSLTWSHIKQSGERGYGSFPMSTDIYQIINSFKDSK